MSQDAVPTISRDGGSGRSADSTKTGAAVFGLDPDADLDLILEVLYAPVFQRWLHRSGPLTPEYADAIVDIALRAFAFPGTG